MYKNSVLFRIIFPNIRLVFSVSILIVFLSRTTTAKAQMTSSCFDDNQLSRMQAASIADEQLRSFMSEQGWSFYGSQSNESYLYFDYSLEYNMVKWQRGSNYLYHYNNNGLPSIVIYQCNYDCFQELFRSETINSKSATQSDNSMQVTYVSKPNGVVFEFREYKNDYSSRQYSVLIYNKASLSKLIKIEKDKEKERFKAEVARAKVEEERQRAEQEAYAKEQEIESRYLAMIAEGDRLLALDEFEGAIVAYGQSQNIKQNYYLYNEKIKGVKEARGNVFVKKGNAFSSAGNYDAAIEEYKKAKLFKSDTMSLNLKIDKQKEYKIRSITYDLEIYDYGKYLSFCDEIKTMLLAKLPIFFNGTSFSEIAGLSGKHYIFRSTYSAKYQLTFSGNNNSQKNSFKLLSGEDQSCKFLKYNDNVKNPTIYYKGYEVMTEANIKEIDVLFVKGITRVKVRNGVVKFRRYSPPNEIQTQLMEDIKTYPNGLYSVNYEVGEVKGAHFVNTEKSKLKSAGTKIVSGAGTVFLVLALTILAALPQ